MDVPRKLLLDTLARRPDLDLRSLSLSIGRNPAYLQQYLMRGSPRELPDPARHALANLLGIAADALRPTAPAGDGHVPQETGALSADRADLPVYASAESGTGRSG